ncbi:MAG: MBL fold metallo-hydrolase [Rhodobiaceae bacterium]|nr:MBL fold metallo-hydrolase [Rhodobiaceae bacterium]MCC0040634.1 MBL fold metallo-hydrolase [Rhodobiaceae bacterium]
MPINRRELMSSAALAGAALALPAGLVAGRAQAAEAGKPAGVFSYKLGDMECLAVNDGVANFPLPDGFVKNASTQEVGAALSRALMDPATMSIPFTAMVVKTGGKTTLIDTGNGPAAGGSRGTLFSNLEAAGIDRGSIDTVVISHFHPDHIGGLTDEMDSKSFANAELVVPEGEVAFWLDDGNLANANEQMKPRFELARKKIGAYKDALRTIGDGAEAAPGVTAHAAHGHTPGHMVFRLASGDRQMMVLSDTTNHPALFVRNPQWQVRFDMDGDMAAQTRVKLLDMVSADDMLVAGYHFPFPATGHIVKDGAGYQLALAAWQPQL